MSVQHRHVVGSMVSESAERDSGRARPAGLPAAILKVLLERIGYGVLPAELAKAQAIGYDAYLDEQLSDSAGFEDSLDAFVQSRCPVETLTSAQLWAYSDVTALAQAQEAMMWRAMKSGFQLYQRMVEFWNDHFNLFGGKPGLWNLLPVDRRTVIRAHALDSFPALLRASTKSAAALYYLDNQLSTAAHPNENYARELLELHTLGVNAGYTQDDVREAARALTGWSIELRRLDDDFGEFAYRDVMHDKGEKNVFGLRLAPGGRMDDGAALLGYLAHHPKTAEFIALKLCRKFVADDAPAACVARASSEFLRTGGDLKATYLAIITSPEFWSEGAFAQKTKTPLEFVASAIRATADLQEVSLPLGRALNTLGQPLYRAQPPTGWPETADAWVNAGALVTRINFGLSLARGQLRGAVPVLPAAEANVDATIDRVARSILGGPPSASTRATLHRALEPKEENATMEPDVALIAGLLVGSPEFQKQ